MGNASFARSGAPLATLNVKDFEDFGEHEGLGLITVTWPLAVAWADDDGVCIDLSFGFTKRLPGRRAGPGTGWPS